MLERTLELSIGDSFWIGSLLVTVIDIDGTNVTVSIEDDSDGEREFDDEHVVQRELTLCAELSAADDD
ncbi:MAG: hypothetical protein D6725_06110 [Planctomycetota bacterium]|nr:MAG: hypothetical protein D6725_06110 [Planctomycetota bacterium]